MAEKRAGFDELLVQLRAANAMLARLLSVEAEMKQGDLVLMLARAGAPAAEIAAILGTTLNTVQVTLSRNRKKLSCLIPVRRTSSSSMPISMQRRIRDSFRTTLHSWSRAVSS